ncbi:MAG: hypothetical protein GVY36_12030 [Verrucomicrobia bacterium]|nr:hypothetical protein [Verrucomicrobiota bacterium]
MTFDFSDATDNNDRTRIRLAFQRFGWETIGGTAYRYPPLTTGESSSGLEDWFNHVIPALMYMRSLVDAKDIEVNNFTIDAFSSTGWRNSTEGPEIGSSDDISMSTETTSGEPVLSESRLRDWLKTCRDATTT